MIASTDLYGAMLDTATAAGYALPAINVTSSETLNGAMRGLADADSDGIIQLTTGGAEYLSGGAVKDMAAGARALAEYAWVLAERYPVLIALHTDHAPPAKFDAFVRPLIEESRRRRARGEQPLFQSHMFDGSTLPLAENLAISARLLAELAPLGIVLEVESGVVGGEEDGIRGPEAGRSELYTTTDDLLSVADALGVGERGRYLLAAAFGNVHGVYAPGNVRLRPEVLADGQSSTVAPESSASNGSADDDARSSPPWASSSMTPGASANAVPDSHPSAISPRRTARASRAEALPSSSTSRSSNSGCPARRTRINAPMSRRRRRTRCGALDRGRRGSAGRESVGFAPGDQRSRL